MAEKDSKETVPGTIGVGTVNGGGGQVKAASNPITKIEDQQTAKEFAKSRYEIPKGDKVTFVTSDCNVFYQANESSARVHARQQNLKLFEITWD